jgi:hypothetical protein
MRSGRGFRAILCRNIKVAIHAPRIVPLSADISDLPSSSGAVLTDSSAMVVDEVDEGSSGDCSVAAVSSTAISHSRQ